MTPSHDSLHSLARRLGRDTSLYASSTVITFVFGVVQVAVMTRLLSLDEFAALALLTVFAAMLTLGYNLGTLQGTLMWVFGGGEEDVASDDDEASRAGASEKRRTLCSALIATALLGAFGTAVVALAAPTLSFWIAADRAYADALVWATAAGGTGAVWRLVINVPRFERRPAAFVALSTLRPALCLAATTSLVASGHGVAGALAGLAVGTVVASALCVAITRRSYELALEPRHVRTVVRKGAVYIPALGAVWIVHNAEIYFVSAFASTSDVALYRLASRLGSGASYFSSAFLMALLPLGATAAHRAAEREHGSRLSARLLSYFVLCGIWVTLALGVLADLLVQVAPSTYAEAAPLIPLIALAFLVHGAFVLTYRYAELPNKRRRYAELSIVAAVLFVVLVALLVPWLGAYGAPAAQAGAFGAALGALMVIAARNGKPFVLEARPVLAGFAIGAAVLIVRAAIPAGTEAAQLALDVAVVVAFPAFVVALGVIPVGGVRSAIADARGTLRRDRPSRSGVERLPAESRQLLRAQGSTLSDDELARAVRSLREIAGAPEPADASWDSDVGAYLLADLNGIDHDALARRLWTNGVEPAEIAMLEDTLRALRRDLRRRDLTEASA